jgi:putative toxin-antitoxin system antitoxin component (TIGR02293 family)
MSIPEIAKKMKAKSAPGQTAGRKKHPGAVLPWAPSAAGPTIQSIRDGLSFRHVEWLRRDLGVSLDKLSAILGIARATLNRRKVGGRLTSRESDRVIRFQRLFNRALIVLESPDNARAWFFAPQRGIGDEVPVRFAETEVGAREVEDLLERIDHGIYS